MSAVIQLLMVDIGVCSKWLLMMGVTVDPQVVVVEQKNLRQDTGHSAPRTGAVGVLSLGTLMIVSGKRQ